MNYYKLNHGTYPGITHVYFNCLPEELIKYFDNKYKKNKLSKEEFPN
jgi:hypothetical protein